MLSQGAPCSYFPGTQTPRLHCKMLWTPRASKILSEIWGRDHPKIRGPCLLISKGLPDLKDD